MTKTNLYVGTSGWQYADWKGRFYPDGLKKTSQLAYYCGRFNSVEINSTFYRMPSESAVNSWAVTTSQEFIFSVKASRFFSHSKRLIVDQNFSDRLKLFQDRLRPLSNKLGVVLIQLPPNFPADIGRLKNAAEAFSRINTRTAFEFRNDSWFKPEVFEILKKHNMANVINSAGGRWPESKQITADFAYIRFHGGKSLYRSSYSASELHKWSGFIKKLKLAHVFVYFNNDFHAHAVNNANELLKLLKEVL